MKRTYVQKIKDNSSVSKALTADRRSALKGAYITHINGDRVFNTAQATKKLEALAKVFLKKRDQGVEFTFDITFAPEKKLTGNYLKKAIDDFHGFKAGTTKRIKSKPDDFEALDDNTSRFPFKTKVYKVFDGVEYKGEIRGYDKKQKTYKIVYEDDDVEDLYHNEVKEYSKGWTLPKHKRWRRKRNCLVTNHLNNFAPTKQECNDCEGYVATLSVEDIRNMHCRDTT